MLHKTRHKPLQSAICRFRKASRRNQNSSPNNDEPAAIGDQEAPYENLDELQAIQEVPHENLDELPKTQKPTEMESRHRTGQPIYLQLENNYESTGHHHYENAGRNEYEMIRVPKV